MLHHLSIQGLAIIDSLSIEFSSGFNVITGETGAGKSILIKALTFLMGAKGSPDTVRKGCDSATVAGEFLVPADHEALDMLSQLGIPSEEVGGFFSILVRRRMNARGRSQCWINDVGVTAKPLREMGKCLIDLFAQHENQRLMETQHHVQYLDNFLPDPKKRTAVGRLYRESVERIEDLVDSMEVFYQGEKNSDYLNFRLNELKKFNPSEKDYHSISELCQKAKDMARVKSILSTALSYLEGEGTSVSESVFQAARSLEKWGVAGQDDKRDVVKWVERANRLAQELDDLNFDLQKIASGYDFEEQDLEEAEARLFGYQDLMRKHGVSEISELIQEQTRMEKELSFLESAAQNFEQSLHSLVEMGQQLQAAAVVLSKERHKASEKIQRAVGSELEALAMPGAKFEVELSPTDRSFPELNFRHLGEVLEELWETAQKVLAGVTESGAERAQFKLAANRGEAMLPLAKVASGGEMSRIMLALKKALVADADTCVLVFDEIDSGISGRVADVVGRKMQELANSFQVICISHLPQVAVYADTHFLVQKQRKKTRTESSIVRLSSKKSAEEVARLLSGDKVSPSSLANAKTLMAKAVKFKRKVNKSEKGQSTQH